MSELNELSKRTDQVFDHIQEAARILNRPLHFNGFGILSDPSMMRSRLHDARKAIEAAQMAMSGATWPSSDADYDRLEAEHNALGREAE